VKFYLITGGILVADQITKFLALKFLPAHQSLKIFPAFLWLTLQHNSGAAFSLLSNHTYLLTGFTAMASVFIILWGIRLPKNEKLMKIALGFVAGGALGNLADRFFRGGEVVDFIDIHWFERGNIWPVFNIADTAICIGVGIIILDSFLTKKKSPSRQESKK